MQTKQPIISVENISKTYSKEPKTGIQNLSFTIESHKIYVLLGESGSGKSTLLRCIYGLVSPDEGQVFCQGKKVIGPAEKLIPGHESMRLVTQDNELNTFATVYDNIASQFSNQNLEEKHQKTEKIIEVLKLNHLKTHKIKTLSGGEQQRVALAKAMVNLPPILLLDEPFSQLDTLLKSQLREDILGLKKQLGTTVLMVTHDPTDAYFLADEILVLKDGYLLQKATIAKLKETPKNIYIAQLFGDANILRLTNSWLFYLKKQGINAKQIGIYPEDIQIFVSADEGYTSAKIVSIRQINFYFEIKIFVFEQELKAIITSQEHSFSLHQEVWIEFKKLILFAS